MGTLGGESFGNRAPDAAGRAGDECHPPRKACLRRSERQLVQLERPEFDPEAIVGVKRRERLKGLGIAHHPHRMPVDVRDDARGACVPSQSDHANARQEDHAGSWINRGGTRGARVRCSTSVHVVHVPARPCFPCTGQGVRECGRDFIGIGSWHPANGHVQRRPLGGDQVVRSGGADLGQSRRVRMGGERPNVVGIVKVQNRAGARNCGYPHHLRRERAISPGARVQLPDQGRED